MGQPNSDLPLDGITVVALEQAVAAPLATRHLADMGARVIKIERVGEGDFARHYDQAVHGQASHFVWLNRSKESIAVDVKSDPGRQILLDLVARPVAMHCPFRRTRSHRVHTRRAGPAVPHSAPALIPGYLCPARDTD